MGISEAFRMGVREARKAIVSAGLLARVNWDRVETVATAMRANDAVACAALYGEIAGPLFRSASGEPLRPESPAQDERLSRLAFEEVLSLARARTAAELELACCEWIDSGRIASDLEPDARRRIGILVSDPRARLGLIARYAPAVGAVRTLQETPFGVRDNVCRARDAAAREE